MRRLLCHSGFMIAPDRGVGKGYLSGKIKPDRNHNAARYGKVRHFGLPASRIR